MLNDITSKGTETFDGNEAPYTNCRLNLPQRKQRIADLLIYFQCRRIQALIYDIYIIYVCQCGDLRRCKTCAEMLLLQSLASSLVESSEFSAFRCSPELRALELQNLLVASSCMPQTSPKTSKQLMPTYACTSVPAHNAKSAAALRIIHQ